MTTHAMPQRSEVLEFADRKPWLLPRRSQSELRRQIQKVLGLGAIAADARAAKVLYSDLTKSAQGRWGNANRMRDGLILTYPGGPTEQLLFPLFQPLRLPWIEILQSGSCQCSGSKRSQRTFNASICSERQGVRGGGRRRQVVRGMQSGGMTLGPETVQISWACKQS